MLTRDEARKLKRDGEAYFINHGKDMRMNPTMAQTQDRREKKGWPDEWETVDTSSLAPEQRKILGSGFLKVTTLQYQPYRKAEISQ